MSRRTSLLGSLATLLWCAAAGAADLEQTARPQQTSVMIGEGFAVLRDEYRPSFSRTEETLLLELPAEVDPATLFVGDARGSVTWLETRWIAPEVPAFDGTLDLTRPGVVRTNERAPRAASRVECVLRADTPRPRSVWATYHVSNLSWRAYYDLTIRGDISNQLEPLSLDLEGRYFLSNGLARAISASQVQVRGPGRISAIAPSPARDPGILLLDEESPLADRWRPREPLPDVPQLYTVPGDATLPAGEVTAVRFASARRIPTERLYAMEGEQIPIGSLAIWKPLQGLLSFRNDRRVGLGLPLPPGIALISSGVGRGSIRQEAMLDHTSAGGAIRVHLGAASGVQGARRSLGRARGPSGFMEETIELWVTNSLASAIRVEISERPPAPLAWDMVRSSRSYEILNRRLRYDLEVDPQSATMINYTVRLTEPEE